jgi:predicted RNase H-like HicB family nuclease
MPSGIAMDRDMGFFYHAGLGSARFSRLKNGYIENMTGMEPLQIEIDREEDGRFLASVPDLPGVMAYDTTRDGAIRKAKSLALQVLAEMIDSGEDVPAPLGFLFEA